MADTFDPYLKIRLPETGAYNNSWGSVLNADAFTLLGHAITGETEVAIGTSLAFSLGALADGAASAARYFCLKITGTPAAAFTFTLPGTVTKKFYLIDNQAGQSGTIKYAGGATVVVPTGERRLVWCDGTSVVNVFSSASDSSALGGIAAASYARLDIANSFAKTNRFPFQVITDAPTVTIDALVSANQRLTLAGNRVMAAPTNMSDGQLLHVFIEQDGTGSRLISSWNSVFLFENGITPTLTTTPGAVDMFLMIYNASLNKWFVGHFANVTAPSGATYNYRITENVVDWNLLAKVGTPGGAVTVNITVTQGTIIQATGTGTPAIDLSGLPAGSTVNLFDFGYIIGKGGDGGKGASFGSEAFQQDQTTTRSENGFPGGNAILGPGSGRSFNITNASGRIWGAGGGGAGGETDGTVGTDTSAAGGGGGGGAGGGRGGGRSGTQMGSGGTVSSPGTAGSTGPNGVGGVGGAAGSNGLTGYAGATGGTFGVAGGNETSGYATAGGAAGKAIELAGGTANFISGSGSPFVLGLVS